MEWLQSLLGRLCLGSLDDDAETNSLQANSTAVQRYSDKPSCSESAKEFVDQLFAARRKDSRLDVTLHSIVEANGWYDDVAAAILDRLVQAIEAGQEMAPVMRAAYERAVDAMKKIEQWVEDNPEMAVTIATIIAIGILAMLAPWVLSFLGFAEEGIIAGSWAARWQALYRGFVPKGSLFSYLQSLGTRIGLGWVHSHL